MICGQSSPRSSPRLSLQPTPQERQQQNNVSFRKIFSILVLIGRPGRIRAFVEEGVRDSDLPLVKKFKKNGVQFSLVRANAKDKRLKCFKYWRYATLVKFAEIQEKLLAPFFSKGPRGNLRIFPIKEGETLPFTTFSQIKRGRDGDIFKVKIHLEHYAFEAYTVSLSYGIIYYTD
jgi:hypothetical protein